MRIVELNVLNDAWPVDQERLRMAVQHVLEEAGVENAEVSVAVVDDATIWRLNREHLQHDYPTDVLSFRLDDETDDEPLEGQLVVSYEMASARAAEFEWSPADELLLYVIHGALHLVGYDDHERQDLQEMRAAEQRHLARWGAKRAAVARAVRDGSGGHDV